MARKRDQKGRRNRERSGEQREENSPILSGGIRIVCDDAEKLYNIELN